MFIVFLLILYNNLYKRVILYSRNFGYYWIVICKNKVVMIDNWFLMSLYSEGIEGNLIFLNCNYGIVL